MVFFKKSVEDNLSLAEKLEFLSYKKTIGREAALMKIFAPMSNLLEYGGNTKNISLYQWYEDIELIDSDLSVDKILFLDTETSHLNGFVSSIALILTDIDGKELDSCYIEVNPQVKQDKEAVEVHGLSDEYLSSKPKFFEIEQKVNSFLDRCDVIVAHNAIYDIGVLIREYERMSILPHTKLNFYIDSMNALKKQFSFEGKIKSPSLKESAKALGIDLNGVVLHNSLDDTTLLKNVFFKAIETEEIKRVKNE